MHAAAGSPTAWTLPAWPASGAFDRRPLSTYRGRGHDHESRTPAAPDRTQRVGFLPRHPACRAEIRRLPDVERPCGQATVRPGCAVSRQEQWRPERNVADHAVAELAIPPDPGTGSARTARTWADRKDPAGRLEQVQPVRPDLARHRHMQQQAGSRGFARCFRAVEDLARGPGKTKRQHA